MVMQQQQPSVLEQASNAMIGTSLSGIIGLGSNRGSTASSGNSSGYVANFYDSIAGQFFIRNPTAVNFTFGMMLNTPLSVPRGSNSSSAIKGAGDPAGILHWLQPDPSAYDSSKVSWVDATSTATIPTVASNSTGAGDWFVGLDGWVLNSGNNHVSNTNSVVGTVDPLYTDMYLPADQARLIRTCFKVMSVHFNGRLMYLCRSSQMMRSRALRCGQISHHLDRSPRRGLSHVTRHLVSASLSARRHSRLIRTHWSYLNLTELA